MLRDKEDSTFTVVNSTFMTKSQRTRNSMEDSMHDKIPNGLVNEGEGQRPSCSASEI